MQLNCKSIVRSNIFSKPSVINLEFSTQQKPKWRNSINVKAGNHNCETLWQSAISRIENGSGGGISILLKPLNYYSNFFVVLHILFSKFEVVQFSNASSPMESESIERLKLWKQKFNTEIIQIVHLLEVK